MIDYRWSIDINTVSVIINQAVGQIDPSGTFPVFWTSTFNKPVTLVVPLYTPQTSVRVNMTTIAGSSNGITSLIVSHTMIGGSLAVISARGAISIGTTSIINVNFNEGTFIDQQMNYNSEPFIIDNSITLDRTPPIIINMIIISPISFNDNNGTPWNRISLPLSINTNSNNGSSNGDGSSSSNSNGNNMIRIRVVFNEMVSWSLLSSIPARDYITISGSSYELGWTNHSFSLIKPSIDSNTGITNGQYETILTINGIIVKPLVSSTTTSGTSGASGGSTSILSPSLSSSVNNNNMSITIISRAVMDAAANMNTLSSSLSIIIDIASPSANIIPFKFITNQPTIQFNVTWYYHVITHMPYQMLQR